MSKEIVMFVSTYNKSHVTKQFLDTVKLIDLSNIDIVVMDDLSTDDTEQVVSEYDIVKEFITKPEGKGLTDSWNMSYKYFKNSEYKYAIFASNDTLIPRGAIEEMTDVLVKWPCNFVVPLSTDKGAGHNRVQSIDVIYGPDSERNNPENYQQVQDILLQHKENLRKANNLYQVDPFRMKMHNGFLFMLSRKLIDYERKDGNLWDPQYINIKNDDNLNWEILIPNNEFAFLCRTAFVYHFKGLSLTGSRTLANTENWKELR
jgi:glycosyltransferase involved in cell wall biosynthesis